MSFKRLSLQHSRADKNLCECKYDGDDDCYGLSESRTSAMVEVPGDLDAVELILENILLAKVSSV